jgi:hypothetical protein
MGVNERLAAIEAKLGIEPQDDGFGAVGLFWDGGQEKDTNYRFGMLRDDENGNVMPFDGESHWAHFLPLPEEIVEQIYALGIKKLVL